LSAVLRDNRATIIPASVTWRAADPNVVSIIDTTHVLAVSEGATQLTGTAKGASATILVRVVSTRDLKLGDGGACAVRTDGRIYCWGGTGKASAVGGGRALPTLIPSSTRFTSVALGRTHACAVAESGDGYCWGTNEFGQLGGATPTFSATPLLVPGGFKYTQISAGEFMSCGLTTSGQVVCWGSNLYGLGSGPGARPPGPLPIASNATFSQLISTYYNSCALASDGQAICWGTSPAIISGGYSYRALSGAGNYVCGVTVAGDVVCWTWAITPDGPFTAPNASLTGRGLTSVSTTYDAGSKCGLTTAGAAVCWQGNLPATAADFGGSLRFRSFSLFSVTNCGLTIDGRPYCWGDNRFGEIGDGTTTNSAVPVAVRMP
jgi:alpha-tubulin suppressor-like RCC1 family protein